MLTSIPSLCAISFRGDRLALSIGLSLPLSATWNETETEFIDYPEVGPLVPSDQAVNSRPSTMRIRAQI